ncbi:MAG: AAA family ATPase [Angustibacter sp.]
MAGLKGGVGKTTTAVHLAAAWAAGGRRVMVVDADPQGSALSWSETGDLSPVVVVGLAVKDLHRRLPDLAAGWDVVVIDTPPGHVAITTSAIRAANEVILPMPPSLMDLDRLRPTLELLADADALRAEPITPRVLLTRVRRGTLNARAARDVLTELELHVLTQEIGLKESYVSAFGAPVTDLGEYAAAAMEITTATKGTPS